MLKQISEKLPEITNSWNPVTGCLHMCVYCWARKYVERLSKIGVEPYASRGFKPTLVVERLRKKFSKKSFIFVSIMGDLFGEWVPETWIEKVFNCIRAQPTVYFFLLTKNPSRYLELGRLPENTVASATIESNRCYPDISKAPVQSIRIEAMKNLKHRYKALVLEPILDFDIDEFIEVVREISPVFVYIGYDNYRFNLPEPPLEKTLRFIEKISEFTEVRLGSIRKAWYE
ncbi:MAG: phage Gp37/Gp68 family protein [Aigarchaeota archaeon]|nr:phage Gp37/Gp68 family protein [Aigarchaeota archaeon]MCX8193101.1 phage Gp37/Gp68 family protein [Nitrososphaeria archaeon]MDW7986724.1 DUF5131 family protein [Nitrososphaerota archaeon]